MCHSISRIKMLFHQIRSKIKNRVREKKKKTSAMQLFHWTVFAVWNGSRLLPLTHWGRAKLLGIWSFFFHSLYTVKMFQWSALWSRHVGKSVSLRYHLNNYVRDKYRLSSNKPVVKVQTQCSSVTAHNRHDRHGVVRRHLYPHTYSKAGKRAVTRRTSRFDNETNKK